MQSEIKKEKAKEKAKKLYELVEIEEVEKGFRLRNYESD